MSENRQWQAELEEYIRQGEPSASEEEDQKMNKQVHFLVYKSLADIIKKHEMWS